MSALEGTYFIVVEDGCGEHQGEVCTRIYDDYYLVRYFSCIDGSPTNMGVVCLSEMDCATLYRRNEDYQKTWAFYSNREEMVVAWQRMNES